MGKIRLGTKSDQVACLQHVKDLIPLLENPSTATPVEVIVFDGAAIVNVLLPEKAKTISEHASQVFMPYITSQMQHAVRSSEMQQAVR